MSDDTERCPACHDTECCGAGLAENDEKWRKMHSRLSEALSRVNVLTEKLSRYESLDASAPILDAASVAEFAGLARSVAASHERLRTRLESAESAKNQALQGDTQALECVEHRTAERLAWWLEEKVARGILSVPTPVVVRAIRRGEWKAGPK